VTSEELGELWPAAVVVCDHLAIENGVVKVEQSGKRGAELVKAVEVVAVARDQAAAAMLEIGEGAEAIVLEVEEPVGIVERLLRRVGMIGCTLWQCHSKALFSRFRASPKSPHPYNH